MTESSSPDRQQGAAASSRIVLIASAVLPLLLIAGMAYLFLSRGTGLDLAAPAPIERLEFERIVFTPNRIVAHVVNTGPEPVSIEQVQIGWTNRATWEFDVEPPGPIPRLGRAVVRAPYPWVPGEPYEIALITANSLIFTHEIEIAAATPELGLPAMSMFALLGIYVGVIPVFLGIGWLPFLRALPQHWYFFLLSLTVGLLVFLGVDSLHEALEQAATVPVPYQGVAIVVMGVVLTVLVLYAVSIWMKKRSSEDDAGRLSPMALAYSVAFGIGVHNLGEGLAIGAAYALGEVAIGALLVLGFTLHNLTEGVAIVAPVVRSRFHWGHLVWMGLLAGAPTIAGAMIGAFAYTPIWAVLFLAIGAGAIAQVVIEITRYQTRSAGLAALASGGSLAGFVVGLGLMYLTGLFLTA
jgi:zinc transporter ZupT